MLSLFYFDCKLQKITCLQILPQGVPWFLLWLSPPLEQSPFYKCLIWFIFLRRYSCLGSIWHTHTCTCKKPAGGPFLKLSLWLCLHWIGCATPQAQTIFSWITECPADHLLLFPYIFTIYCTNHILVHSCSIFSYILTIKNWIFFILVL